MNAQPLLLSIIELGGYPNFSPLYQQAGYQVEILHSIRKAAKALKKLQPRVIVAEFNYQPDFRDRISNLEPVLAVVQQHLPATRVILLYEVKQAQQLEKLRARFPFFHALPFPIQEAALRAELENAGKDG